MHSAQQPLYLLCVCTVEWNASMHFSPQHKHNLMVYTRTHRSHGLAVHERKWPKINSVLWKKKVQTRKAQKTHSFKGSAPCTFFYLPKTHVVDLTELHLWEVECKHARVCAKVASALLWKWKAAAGNREKHIFEIISCSKVKIKVFVCMLWVACAVFLADVFLQEVTMLLKCSK